MGLDPNRPQEYPRRVLVCVVGMSPAVVTETLYALAKKEDPAFVPTEVHVVTTTEGARGIRERLLSDGTGAFHRLLAEHLPGLPVTFGGEGIHVVRAGERELGDIVSAADQVAMADTILRVLRRFAADPECAIHASIAGGRKSMSFYMGYAMSLLARPQDRMSHVLVTQPGYEHRDFFYPTLASQPLQTNDGSPLDACNAHAAIELAPVSFVRLGEGGADWLRRSHSSFEDAVAMAQAAVAPQPVVLRLDSRTVECARQCVTLSPTEMAWYAFFARLRHERRDAGGLLPDGAVMLDVGYKDCKGLDPATLDWAFRNCGLATPDLAGQRQPINNKLKPVFSDIRKKLETLGPQARWLEIGGRSTKGDGLYGLFNLPPELITINTRTATGAA
jgi:CRISPR-associated protein (TIGR02584 family)